MGLRDKERGPPKKSRFKPRIRRGGGGGGGGWGSGLSERFTVEAIINLVIRLCQLFLGLAVVGLYAQDLNKARRENKYSDGKWVLATVVGSISAVTGLIFAIFPIISGYLAVAMLFGVDAIIFILWCAVFGVFGSMYIHEKAEMDVGVQRMKNAVWVDLVNLLLWFITAVMGAVALFTSREGRGRGGSGGGGYSGRSRK